MNEKSNFCKKCGAEANIDWNFCECCGESFVKISEHECQHCGGLCEADSEYEGSAVCLNQNCECHKE